MFTLLAPDPIKIKEYNKKHGIVEKPEAVEGEKAEPKVETKAESQEAKVATKADKPPAKAEKPEKATTKA